MARDVPGDVLRAISTKDKLIFDGSGPGANLVGIAPYYRGGTGDYLRVDMTVPDLGGDIPVSGHRKVFDKQTWDAASPANLTQNPALTSTGAGVVVMPAAETSDGTVPYWKGIDMPAAGSTFLETQAELVDVSGVRYLKLDQSQANTSGIRNGVVAQTVTVPKRLLNRDLEVSFDFAGLANMVYLGANYKHQIRVYIDPTTPKRLSYILPAEENTSESLLIKFERMPDSLLVSGKYMLIGRVRVAEATFHVASTNLGIPATGHNFQIFRLEADFEAMRVTRMLARTRETGAILRVFIQANRSSFSTFSGGVWSALNTSGAGLTQLDTFVEMAHQAGVKLILTFFNEGANGGDQLDDLAKGAAFGACCGAVAARYKDYPNIFAYDLDNEGFAQWAINVALKTGTAVPLAYDGFRKFQKAAYDAIKAADPSALVMLTSGYAVGFSPFGYDTLIAPEEIADVVGYSIYAGQFACASTSSGSPTGSQVSTTTGKFVIDSRMTGGLVAGVPVYVAAAAGGSLGSALTAGTVYYMVNVNASAGEFYLSATLGGAAVTTLTGMSGTINVANTDGTMVAMMRDVLLKVASSQRLPIMITEMGGPTNLNLNGTTLYRDRATAAKYYRKYAEVLYDYGFFSLMAWNEWGSSNTALDLLFDAAATVRTEAGRALADIGYFAKGRRDIYLEEIERRITALTAAISGATMAGVYGATAGSDTVGLTSSIAAGVTAVATSTLTVTGAATGASVMVTPTTAPTSGIVYTGIVTSANTVTLYATNCTSGSVTPATVTLRVQVTNF